MGHAGSRLCGVPAQETRTGLGTEAGARLGASDSGWVGVPGQAGVVSEHRGRDEGAAGGNPPEDAPREDQAANAERGKPAECPRGGAGQGRAGADTFPPSRGPDDGRRRGRAGLSPPTNSAPPAAAPADPRHGRAAPAPGPAAAAAAAAAARARPGRPRASGAGREGCPARPHPEAGAAAGGSARGRPAARGLAEVPAAPAPAVAQGPHALLSQGSHWPSRDTAPTARAACSPALLILRPRAWARPCEPCAGPTSSRRLALVAPVPVWHCGCILPLLRGSRAGSCRDALSRWPRGWLGRWPAGTAGSAQSTLSGRAASLCELLGVLPLPCLSPPCQGEHTDCPGSIYSRGAHPARWVSCPPFPAGRSPSWRSGEPTRTSWGPWAPLLQAMGQQERGALGSLSNFATHRRRGPGSELGPADCLLCL